jgi:hypothetical protein
MSWLGVPDLLEPIVGDGPTGWPISRSELFGVPGVDVRTQLRMRTGFAVSSLLVMDVPATDQRITVGHPTFNTQTLPGLELTSDLGSPQVQWLVRDGVVSGTPTVEPAAIPGATASAGEVPLGTDATVLTSDGPLVLRLSDVDTVRAYPGLQPAAGNVFVEVRVEQRNFLQSFGQAGFIGFRAVGSDGRELRIVRDEDPSVPTSGVLMRLRPEHAIEAAWIVIEAPERGPIRLEYRSGDAADATFFVRIRE